jgi:hypothetical protein
MKACSQAGLLGSLLALNPIVPVPRMFGVRAARRFSTRK